MFGKIVTLLFGLVWLLNYSHESSSIYRLLFETYLKNKNDHFVSGCFCIHNSLDSTTLHLGNDNICNNNGCDNEMTVLSNQFYKNIVLTRDIGLGESYINQHWTYDDRLYDLGDIMTQFIVGITNDTAININTNYNGNNGAISSVIASYFTNIFSYFMEHLMNYLIIDQWYQWYERKYLVTKSINEDKNNIMAHYDVGNELYSTFLDQTMTYSCAFFMDNEGSKGNNGNNSDNGDNSELYNAQINKIDLLMNKMDINSDDNVLEIGSGWGFTSFNINNKTNANVTGITVSEQQYYYSIEKFIDTNYNTNNRENNANSKVTDQFETLIAQNWSDFNNNSNNCSVDCDWYEKNDTGHSCFECACTDCMSTHRDKEETQTTTATRSAESSEQTSKTTQNSLSVEKSGLSYKLIDYRDTEELSKLNINKIISIGMFEHVGIKNINEYFSSVSTIFDNTMQNEQTMQNNSDTSDNSNNEYIFGLHYITLSDITPGTFEVNLNKACEEETFINKYIFPGGCLIAANWATQVARNHGLILLHEEYFGLHYAKTLHIWRKNWKRNFNTFIRQFNAKYSDIIDTNKNAMDSTRLYLLYEMYFAYCEALFRSGQITLVQQVFMKPNSNVKRNKKYNDNNDNKYSYNAYSRFDAIYDEIVVPKRH